MISAEKKKRYIEDGGIGCPNCNGQSEDVETNKTGNDDDVLNECKQCGFKWFDISKLVDIEEVE